MSARIIPVAQTELPAIVTHLHIHAPLAGAVPDAPEQMHITHEPSLSLERYRALFIAIGATWLWQGRLRMSDEQLTAYLEDPNTSFFVLRQGGKDIGLADLDCRNSPPDLAYFGLTEAAIGTGASHALMGHVLREAFQHGDVVHVQTCTLDHPRALRFYQKCGFQPVRREIEIIDDPRQSGLLPRDAAPQIPLLTKKCAESL